MTTILLFHHAHGQTPGFLAFADDLRSAGHTVHAPDLYEGRVFNDLDEGVEHARQTGFGEITRRGAASAEALPTDIVYAGFSLGVMSAQSLAQGRPGARGALLYHGALPPSEFGGPWPDGVPLQIHMMEHDPWAEEDVPAAQALVGEAGDGELFLYPGSGHLFAERGYVDYDDGAAQLLWGAHAGVPRTRRVAGQPARATVRGCLNQLSLPPHPRTVPASDASPSWGRTTGPRSTRSSTPGSSRISDSRTRGSRS